MRLYSIYVLLLLTAACVANVLNVPSEQYPSIQQAINLALSGDTIIVAPGRYFENINFLGKAITVRSSDPNDPNIVAATIIDGNRPADVNFASVVTFKNGETSNSVLEGFTITGGTGSWLQVYWQYQRLSVEPLRRRNIVLKLFQPDNKKKYHNKQHCRPGRRNILLQPQQRNNHR